MTRFLVCLLLLVPLAGASIPASTTPLDWAEADENWSIHVVTVDPNGNDRVTRISMSGEGGNGALRTNDSRWWANLQREPKIRVRHGGADHTAKLSHHLARNSSASSIQTNEYSGEGLMHNHDRNARSRYSLHRTGHARLTRVEQCHSLGKDR